MTIQEIGVWAIFLCMLIAYLQKNQQPASQPDVPILTRLAVAILMIIGAIDVYLWLLELGTFTAHIKSLAPPAFGFVAMGFILYFYWRRRGTVEALDVTFGILMGHFWWSW